MTDAPEREYLDDVPQELQDLLYEGRKIEAIKLVCERKGLGLKDAKDRVETIQGRLRELAPEAFAASKAGCGAAACGCPPRRGPVGGPGRPARRATAQVILSLVHQEAGRSA